MGIIGKKLGSAKSITGKFLSIIDSPDSGLYIQDSKIAFMYYGIVLYTVQQIKDIVKTYACTCTGTT